MTVCVAAICEGNIILGASDRMITSGDIQFQPPSLKIKSLTSSIVVMTSGDAAFQTEVLQRASVEVLQRITDKPDKWLSVDEAVDIIIRHRNEAKSRRAEAAVLAPLGLDGMSFLQGLHGLGDALSRTIATDLVQFAVPHTSSIVCGVDDTGAHIYSIFDGVPYCNDIMGFAAIGIGQRHAESQFMSAEHTRDRSLAETLLLVYSAKKRAEIAPGVGTATDVFTAGPSLGSVTVVSDQIVARVDREFKRILGKERRALATAKSEMETYVNALRNPPATTQEATSDYLEGDGKPSA